MSPRTAVSSGTLVLSELPVVGRIQVHAAVDEVVCQDQLFFPEATQVAMWPPEIVLAVHAFPGQQKGIYLSGASYSFKALPSS